MLLCNTSIMNRYGKNKLDDLLTPYNLDWYRLAAIYLIDAVPGVSQNDMIPFLQTDKGNVSKIIKKLIDDELIYTQKNEIDHRIKGCYLTQNGIDMLPTLKAIMNDWENTIYQNISKEDLDIFERVSSQISTNLTQHLERLK